MGKNPWYFDGKLPWISRDPGQGRTNHRTNRGTNHRTNCRASHRTNRKFRFSIKARSARGNFPSVPVRTIAEVTICNWCLFTLQSLEFTLCAPNLARISENVQINVAFGARAREKNTRNNLETRSLRPHEFYANCHFHISERTSRIS